MYVAHLGWNFQHTLSALLEQKNWQLEVGDVGTETMKERADMKLVFVFMLTHLLKELIWWKSILILSQNQPLMLLVISILFLFSVSFIFAFTFLSSYLFLPIVLNLMLSFLIFSFCIINQRFVRIHISFHVLLLHPQGLICSIFMIIYSWVYLNFSDFFFFALLEGLFLKFPNMWVLRHFCY